MAIQPNISYWDSLLDKKKESPKKSDIDYWDSFLENNITPPNILVSPEEIDAKFQTQASSTRVETKYKIDEDIEVSPEMFIPEKEREIYSVKQDVRQWYNDRGGISPEDKISLVTMTALDLKDKVDLGEMTKEEFGDEIKTLTSNLGLEYREGEGIFAFPHEVEQYNDLLGKEFRKRLAEKEEAEKDPVMKRVWNALNLGTEQVLDGVRNAGAIGEKISKSTFTNKLEKLAQNVISEVQNKLSVELNKKSGK